MSDSSCAKATKQYNDVVDIDDSSIYPVQHRAFFVTPDERGKLSMREMSEEEANVMFRKESRNESIRRSILQSLRS